MELESARTNGCFRRSYRAAEETAVKAVSCVFSADIAQASLDIKSEISSIISSICISDT